MLFQKLKHWLSRRRSAHRYLPAEPPYALCRNCSNELQGKYCSVCGQFAHMTNRPFTDSVKFYLDHNFALDHKLGHTLFYLFFRPSYLTREFMNGKIERYVHPFKLYFFSSILLFSLVVALPSRNQSEDANRPILENIQPPAELGRAFDQFKGIIEREGKSLTPADRARILAQLDSLKSARFSSSSSAIFQIKDDSTLNSTLERNIVKRLTDTPKSELYERFLHYLSLAMLLLMPFFATLLMLLYRKKERYYTAHLIHSLHLHVVLFIIIALSAIWSYLLPSTSITLWLIIYWLIYYIFSLSYFYGEGRRKSLAKGIALLLVYLIVSVVAVAGVGLLSVIL